MSNLLQRIALVAAVIGMPAPASAQTTDSTPEARQQMQAYGACVADRSAAKASQTLSSDFRTQKYHLAMRALNDNNRDCSRLLPRRSKMYSSSLLFAGAMAERLMAAGPRPLNVRLAEAAARPAPTFYSQSDAIAMCVIRSAPDKPRVCFQAMSEAQPKSRRPGRSTSRSSSAPAVALSCTSTSKGCARCSRPPPSAMSLH